MIAQTRNAITDTPRAMMISVQTTRAFEAFLRVTGSTFG